MPNMSDAEPDEVDWGQVLAALAGVVRKAQENEQRIAALEAE